MVLPQIFNFFSFECQVNVYLHNYSLEVHYTYPHLQILHRDIVVLIIRKNIIMKNFNMDLSL